MDLAELSDYVINGNAPAAEEWTKKALSEGMAASVIVNQGLIPGMDVVGAKFKSSEYYMPEVLVSARAMKVAMALVKPLLAEQEGGVTGRVVLGTVKGDLHDIGKNLVGMMLEGAGLQVIDVGVDVAVEGFITAAKENQAGVIAASALLTTTMTGMKDLVEAVKASDIDVKVIVGGAPVTQAYCDEIGADGYAADAASAADLAKSLVGA